jgi:alpha-glucosidase (family GH31 glycosyl hydrolase)
MAPGNPVSDPPISALLPSPPAFSTLVSSVSPLQLTNGNLAVSVDAATGYITATRVSDGAVLLRQTALVFDAPSVPNTRPGSHSALVTFAGHAGEKVYGFGEHRTGAVNQMPFQKRFADSEDYGKSRGGDVSIPYYSSSLGYGFLWNSPSYGFVDVSEAAISWYSNACTFTHAPRPPAAPEKCATSEHPNAQP